MPTDRKADLKACPTFSGGETEGPSEERATEHNDGDNRWPRINCQLGIKAVQKKIKPLFLLSKYHNELSERVRNHQNLSRRSGVHHKHLSFVQDTIENFGDLYK